MRIFLRLAAGLAALFATGLLAAPAAFYAPTGLRLTALEATVVQAHGATLMGLAIATLFSSWASPAAWPPILAGNLAMQSLSLSVAIWTSWLGAGAAVAPAFVIHGLLTAAFGLALWRSSHRRGPIPNRTDPPSAD